MKKVFNTTNVVLLVIAILVIYLFIDSKKTFNKTTTDSTISLEPSDMISDKASKYPVARELVEPHGFINTDENINIENLIGKKVILVDFWTYSCINCQRTLPYLTSWYEKYKDSGLEIIGVHTPEFDFEKKIDNVQIAADKWGISYPIVLDNDYATWTAYANRYWPRKYIIDIDGYIVYDHIGEGDYEQTEKVIQNLLEERKQRLAEDIIIPSDMVDPENTETVSRDNLYSPETYFGAWRNDNLGNGTINKIGQQSFESPNSPKINQLYFDGTWDIKRQSAINTEAGAKIVFNYQAQKVFLVASANEDVEIEIIVDGESRGMMTVNEDRLYRLIEDDAWGEHILEIIIHGSGLEAFAFTFG